MYDAVCSRLPSFVRVDKRNIYLTLTCTNLKTTFRSPRSSSRPTIPSVLYDQSRTLKTGSGIVPEDSHTQENQQNCDCTTLILLPPGSESEIQAPRTIIHPSDWATNQLSSVQAPFIFPEDIQKQVQLNKDQPSHSHFGAHTLITGRHGIYISFHLF